MLYLKRKIDAFLSEWKANPDKKPLIVKGPRQVGKTESIQRFAAENYTSVITINFVEEPKYKMITADGYKAADIIKNISRIDPSKRFIEGETLIFFDELQEFPDIATALKFFKIDGRFDVICSGSMLGLNYRKIESNSVGYIIFAHNGATVAIGTGEQDRVGCVELAIFKAYTKYADTLAFTRHGMTLYELKLKAKEDAEAAEQLAAIEADTQKAKGGLSGTVLVSDGFFPFRDGVDVCIAQGVTAIAQPGGSLRDYEVIGAVNEASPQVAMVFTGQRSFKH